MLAAALHCADLHSPLVGPDLDRKLAALIGAEFTAQGALELQAGLKVTVVKADTPLALASMEVGFISFLCRPLFVEFFRLVPELEGLLARVDGSIAMWTQLRNDSVGAAAAEDNNRRRSSAVHVGGRSSTTAGRSSLVSTGRSSLYSRVGQQQQQQQQGLVLEV